MGQGCGWKLPRSEAFTAVRKLGGAVNPKVDADDDQLKQYHELASNSSRKDRVRLDEQLSAFFQRARSIKISQT